MRMITTKPTLRYILKDKVGSYLKRFGEKVSPAILELINMMLLCCDKRLGYRSFYCVNCGHVKQIAFSCKTRLCSRCGKIANERFAMNFVKRMLPVTHRYIVFTIPEALWKLFHGRIELQKLLLQSANESIKEIMSFYNRREVIPGVMAVLHTYGRDLKKNCHVNVIVTEGGYTREGEWRRFTYFPFVKSGRVTKTLNEVWRDNVLDGLRLSLPRTSGNNLFIGGFRSRYPSGFYVYGPNNARIKSNRKARYKAKYITRYVKHPVISDSRIIHYDGNVVKFWYDYPTSKRRIIKEMDVLKFIHCVLSHIPEKSMHQVVYYGLYSAVYSKRSYTQYIFSPCGDVIDPERLTWRERVMMETGVDPQLCKRCNTELLLVCIVSKAANGYYVYYKLSADDLSAIQYPNDEYWIQIKNQL